MQTWLDGKTPPSGALAKCKVCNGLLTLLLELNGDMPEHFLGHERRLYVWACRRKTCRRKEGSVRGIRGVRVAKGSSSKFGPKEIKPKPVQEEAKAPTNLGGSLFGVKESGPVAGHANPFSNPFSTGANGKSPANPFSSVGSSNPFSGSAPSEQSTTGEAKDKDTETPKDEATSNLPETFASKVRLNSPSPSPQTPRPHEPWPPLSSFPPAYPSYYLDAGYETLDGPSAPEIPSNMRVEMEPESSSGGGGGKEDKEVFESSLDRTFQKFADRVGQNAEQVLRYEFGGKPLLYSDADAVGKLLAPYAENGPSSHAKVTVASSKSGSGMPRCQNCGAERVFEVQLTPHAIIELEADEMSIEGMEWGTIILGVCSKDCRPVDVPEGEVGYVEEWVGVQWEEVVSKR
jgi:pre-rRNA-processing protein TSR4